MAQIVTITNPLTGQPTQVDQLEHTAQQIDDGLNIARGVSNPNLLDNWYFVNPVNQRGFTSASGQSGAYTLDRWFIGDIWTSGACAANYYEGESLAFKEGLFQRFEANKSVFANKTLTASALTTGGKLDVRTITLPANIVNGTSYSFTNKETPVFSNDVIRWNSDNIAEFRFESAYAVSLVAVKLELGSQQTLAHKEDGVWVLNEIPDYGEQLALCQRRQYFFNPSGKSVSMIGNGQAYRSDVIFANFTLPTNMAEDGTPILENLDISKIQLRGAGKNLIPTSVAIDGASHGSSFSIVCAVSGATAGAAYDMILFDYNNLGITNNL